MASNSKNLAELLNSDVTLTATDIADGAVSSAKLGTDVSLGQTRNLVMNGAMRVAQRGTSNGGTSTEGYKLADRWKFTQDSTSSTWNHTLSTDVPAGEGFSKSYQIVPNTADTSLAANCQIRLEQRWEGQDLQHLKKGTSNALSTTLSFWVKSVQTGTFVVNLQDTDNSRLIAKTYTVNTTNTWEKKVINFAGDTTGALTHDGNLSMVLHFYLSAGSDYTSGTLATSWESLTTANRAVGQTVDLADSTSNAFYLTGVQWETGDNATDFEHKSYADELRECYRYYWELSAARYGTNTFLPFNVWMESTGACKASVKFPVDMRDSPTIAAAGTWYADGGSSGNPDLTWYGVSSTTSNAARLEWTGSFDVRDGGSPRYKNSDAKLSFDAEL